MMIEKAVAKISELQDGDMREVEVNGVGVLLIRVDGKFYAIGSECTHSGAPLELGTLHGHRLRCPWHQACYDIVTGDMTEPPALDSLSRFDVKIEEDDVIVSVPEGATERRIPDMAKHNPDADSRVFVIVGAGGAGNAAAQTLRQDGFAGRLVMITKESRLPYDRTELSKGYLRSDDSEPDMLREERFYSDYDIEILTNHEVVGTDPTLKSIAFQDGSALKYDKLLLATGSTPRRLDIVGASLENVFTIRNPDDANLIKSMSLDSSHAVIIGASFIGMETAASLAGNDMSITVVAPESVPFEKTLGEEIGLMYKDIHERNGISFKLDSKIAQFVGEEKVQKVVLENGDTLEADFVLMGVGVQPATSFLNGMELNTDGSLSVDKHFRVTEDIYAAGDIASFIDWRTGERIRIEHWRVAEQHGRIAAHNMVGKETEYKSIPFFWTNQLGANLRYVGHAKDRDEIIFRGAPAMRNFVAYYVKNGNILAAAGVGKIAQMPAIAELMRTNQMPTPDELLQGNKDMEELLEKK